MKQVSRRGMLKTLGTSMVAVPMMSTGAVAQVPNTPVVTALRAAQRTDDPPAFDRVVVDLRGPMPTQVRWEQVAQLIQAGSGFEEPIEGSAKYQITLIGAQAHDDAGNVTIAQPVITPRLPLVRQAKLFSDFEDVVYIGIGLSRETRTRTLVINDTARNSVRVVVDFFHS